MVSAVAPVTSPVWESWFNTGSVAVPLSVIPVPAVTLVTVPLPADASIQSIFEPVPVHICPALPASLKPS